MFLTGNFKDRGIFKNIKIQTKLFHFRHEVSVNYIHVYF